MCLPLCDQELALVEDPGGIRGGRLFSASLSPTGVIIEPGGASITSAVFSPDGSSVLTSSQGGTARVWNATTDAQRSVMITEPGNASVVSATFSPDGKLIGTASFDGTARIWGGATGQQLTEFHAGGALSDISFSPGRPQCDHVRRGSDDLVDRACFPAGHDRAAGPPAGAARVLGGRDCHLSAGHRAVGVSPRA